MQISIAEIIIDLHSDSRGDTIDYQFQEYHSYFKDRPARGGFLLFEEVAPPKV